MEDALSSIPAGNVYVFNVYSEDLNLSVNGLQISVGAIPGWSQSGNTRYQPGSAAVPRVLNASDGPGNFFNGNNMLALVWLDGLFMAQIKVDGSQFPLNQDLLVFVSRNQWQLVNQFGTLVGNGQVILAGMGEEFATASV